MTRSLRLLAVTLLLGVAPLPAQDLDQSPVRRHFLGSSGFVAANFVISDPADFYQLNYGYRATDRDVVSVEAITWKYHAPLGIPYGPSLDDPDEDYPGYVREYGVGVAYQRFLWRDVYGGLHVLPLLQHYFDEDGGRIQEGFRLFLTLRAGYHLRLLGDRFFLEPSVAATYWPVSTNVPASFEEKDREWPNYFLFEPGLHLGVNF